MRPYIKPTLLFTSPFLKSRVGVIGGADGPTAIYLRRRPSPLPVFLLGAAAAAAGLAVYRIFCKK